MKISFGVMLFVLCAAIFDIRLRLRRRQRDPDGSSGGDAGSTDTGPTVGTPTIEFKNPKDDATLTPGQDQSAAVEGIQYDVTVETTNVETGRKVVLTNSIDVPVKAYEAPVTVDPVSKKGAAVFASVTFRNGDNQLTATAANSAGKTGTKVITITANEVVDCTFTVPAEGTKFVAAMTPTAPPRASRPTSTRVSRREATTRSALRRTGPFGHRRSRAGSSASPASRSPRGLHAHGRGHNNAGTDAAILRSSPVNTAPASPGSSSRSTARSPERLRPEGGSRHRRRHRRMQAALEFETAFEQYNQRCGNSTVTWSITTPGRSSRRRRSRRNRTTASTSESGPLHATRPRRSTASRSPSTRRSVRPSAQTSAPGSRSRSPRRSTRSPRRRRSPRRSPTPTTTSIRT